MNTVPQPPSSPKPRAPIRKAAADPLPAIGGAIGNFSPLGFRDSVRIKLKNGIEAHREEAQRIQGAHDKEQVRLMKARLTDLKLELTERKRKHKQKPTESLSSIDAFEAKLVKSTPSEPTTDEMLLMRATQRYKENEILVTNKLRAAVKLNSSIAQATAKESRNMGDLQPTLQSVSPIPEEPNPNQNQNNETEKRSRFHSLSLLDGKYTPAPPVDMELHQKVFAQRKIKRHERAVEICEGIAREHVEFTLSLLQHIPEPSTVKERLQVSVGRSLSPLVEPSVYRQMKQMLLRGDFSCSTRPDIDPFLDGPSYSQGEESSFNLPQEDVPNQSRVPVELFPEDLLGLRSPLETQIGYYLWGRRHGGVVGLEETNLQGGNAGASKAATREMSGSGKEWTFGTTGTKFSVNLVKPISSLEMKLAMTGHDDVVKTLGNIEGHVSESDLVLGPSGRPKLFVVALINCLYSDLHYGLSSPIVLSWLNAPCGPKADEVRKLVSEGKQPSPSVLASWLRRELTELVKMRNKMPGQGCTNIEVVVLEGLYGSVLQMLIDGNKTEEGDPIVIDAVVVAPELTPMVINKRVGLVAPLKSVEEGISEFLGCDLFEEDAIVPMLPPQFVSSTTPGLSQQQQHQLFAQQLLTPTPESIWELLSSDHSKTTCGVDWDGKRPVVIVIQNNTAGVAGTKEATKKSPAAVKRVKGEAEPVSHFIPVADTEEAGKLLAVAVGPMALDSPSKMCNIDINDGEGEEKREDLQRLCESAKDVLSLISAEMECGVKADSRGSRRDSSQGTDRVTSQGNALQEPPLSPITIPNLPTVSPPSGLLPDQRSHYNDLHKLSHATLVPRAVAALRLLCQKTTEATILTNSLILEAAARLLQRVLVSLLDRARVREVELATKIEAEGVDNNINTTEGLDVWDTVINAFNFAPILGEAQRLLLAPQNTTTGGTRESPWGRGSGTSSRMEFVAPFDSLVNFIVLAVEKALWHVEQAKKIRDIVSEAVDLVSELGEREQDTTEQEEEDSRRSILAFAAQLDAADDTTTSLSDDGKGVLKGIRLLVTQCRARAEALHIGLMKFPDNASLLLAEEERVIDERSMKLKEPIVDSVASTGGVVDVGELELLESVDTLLTPGAASGLIQIMKWKIAQARQKSRMIERAEGDPTGSNTDSIGAVDIKDLETDSTGDGWLIETEKLVDLLVDPEVSAALPPHMRLQRAVWLRLLTSVSFVVNVSTNTESNTRVSKDLGAAATSPQQVNAKKPPQPPKPGNKRNAEVEATEPVLFCYWDRVMINLILPRPFVVGEAVEFLSGVFQHNLTSPLLSGGKKEIPVFPYHQPFEYADRVNIAGGVDDVAGVVTRFAFNKYFVEVIRLLFGNRISKELFISLCCGLDKNTIYNIIHTGLTKCPELEEEDKSGDKGDRPVSSPRTNAKSKRAGQQPQGQTQPQTQQQQQQRGKKKETPEEAMLNSLRTPQRVKAFDEMNTILRSELETKLDIPNSEELWKTISVKFNREMIVKATEEVRESEQHKLDEGPVLPLEIPNNKNQKIGKSSLSARSSMASSSRSVTPPSSSRKREGGQGAKK